MSEERKIKHEMQLTREGRGKIRLNGKRFLEVWDQRNRKRGGAGKNAQNKRGIEEMGRARKLRRLESKVQEKEKKQKNARLTS